MICTNMHYNKICPNYHPLGSCLSVFACINTYLGNMYIVNMYLNIRHSNHNMPTITPSSTKMAVEPRSRWIQWNECFHIYHKKQTTKKTHMLTLLSHASCAYQLVSVVVDSTNRTYRTCVQVSFRHITLKKCDQHLLGGGVKPVFQEMQGPF